MMAPKDTDISDIEDDDLEEEPGEEIESAPPLEACEEREINRMGLKKKLIKSGSGYETPAYNDEVIVHYVGALVDGTQFVSSRDGGEPSTIKIGHGQVVAGLECGIITMRRGETALFTVPPNMAYGASGAPGVPPDFEVRFEVELISWFSVIDVRKDGGVMKKILSKGTGNDTPGDLDEVTVKYEVMLVDGQVVAKTPEEGLEFCVKDGHLCPALPRVVKTMRRGEKAMVTVEPRYAFKEQGRSAENGFSAIPPNATLSIDLELISFKSVVDVLGYMSVLKKILKEGDGPSANEGAVARVRFSGLLEDGTLFEKKGFDGDDLFEFVIDEEQVIYGLDRAAATMKKGEISIVTIKPEYGFGNIEAERDLAIVPAFSTVVYELEMVDFTKEEESWEMDTHERIKAAETKKEEGNVLYKIGKYTRAAKKYDKAMDYVREDDSFEDNQMKLVKALKVSCWLNNGACSLKLDEYKGAINLCSKVLNVESQNVKALYRRAQAYMGTSDLDLAELDLKKALEVDPQNREVKALHKTLKQMQIESNKRDAKLFGNMFSRMRKDECMGSKKLKLESQEKEKGKEGAVSMDMETPSISTAQPCDAMWVDSS
ncbi:peptidyl-prolyl cis-trans isomerase FKBP62 [Amborella trichopoda]|nr:peptidyl-prolyl cis-trans isomerase FKBP62 [Amborella trichopoda]|eukprot:XP_006857116.2 peptidyl-prolyl cis-trans isomerase FKBP62 [Amborella trichopoda]